MSFKDFDSYPWRPFVQQSQTICAILVEGTMGKIPVNLFSIWTSGSGGDVVQRFFYF